MSDAEGPRDRRVAQVLLDSTLPQLDHLFDYAVPDSLADTLRVGHRVRVPFRSQSRQSYGYVIGFSAHSDFAGHLQPITEIVSPVCQLTPQVWRLARTVADRAGGSASDVLRLAIPQRMVRAEKQHLAQLEAEGKEPDAAGRSKPTLDAAGEVTGEVTDEIAGLLSQGARLAFTASHGPARLATGEWTGGWAVRLASIALMVHACGRSVILVAPDYRDVDQLHDALSALGHEDAVRVDSRQSGSARYAAFLRALDRTPRIVLGNRSAIYAPAHDLGAILVWDDGDPLLAEPLSPYVHARDAALVRADLEQAGLLFAAHSRSAEVQRLIDIGYVQAESVPPRRTRVVAAEALQRAEAFSWRVPDFAARQIRAGLEQGPVLVQVATPGYAPAAVCEQCNTRATCRVCRGPLGFERASMPVCRWCGEHAANWRCDECGATQLAHRGMGSKRTAEQFQQQFPGVRIVLSDGEHPHERVDSRPALVVATRGAEPIAAGGYRAVVLLDAERLLSIESLRAAEDCLRWWSNAAALAAPDARCVLASGSGPVVDAFVTGRTEAWLRAELRDRHELRYPPAVRVASVVGGAKEVSKALQALGTLPGVDVLGPASWSPRTQNPLQQPEVQLQRAIVRFDYAQGAEVAKRLRGALVADAAGTSAKIAGRPAPARAREGSLRLRFDDRAVFDS